ncbi:uncharacterized protein [Mobula birostris]|uniref:uncharacterized protein n=1 Tax=Mobula birostris TaxID=1983395 RepID=UPI003B2807A2
MATNANSRADVLALTEDRDPDPKTALSELLTQWDDYQLFQLGKFYRERLTEAIEGGIGKFSLMLREEGHLSADEHEIIYRLAERGNWMDSSKLFLGLVMGKGSPTWIVMWESFVKVRGELPKLDRILEEIQEFGLGVHEYMNVARGFSESPTELTDVRQRHRETLRARTETLRVFTMQTGAKVQVFRLLDRYAEVTVISRAGRRGVGEHELLAGCPDGGELGEMGLQTELEKIRMDQLFQSSFPRSTSRPRSSAAVVGVPGIGKTTMVQKIVNDWAMGKIYQQFQFVFSFKFRDLNNLNCRVNLRELILDQYPYFGNTLGEVWKDPEKLLFIFDGLDEFKDRMDFADGRRDTEPQHACTDPEFRCKVSDIVYSLIQHELLPGCSVLVTTRPTALPLLEKADISVWAEILGFVGEERKEYFSRHFEDQAVASAVFEHVQENEILYTMSYNPACCLILALALGPFFTLTVRDPRRVPQTITQLYSCYLYSVLKNHGQELKSPCDLLLRIGQMAFTGVSESNIIFTDGDLTKWNLRPSQLLSGFPTELLEREESAQSEVYTFPHLTVQEFIAALAQFLAPDPGDLNLLAEARGKEDGRFEMFLRFAAGLSAAGSTQVLEEFLGPLPCRTAGWVADWVREEVGRQIRNMWGEAGQKRLLNALHYLFESQDRGLAQATLGSVDVLSFCGLRLTPIDCAVLSHAIGLCDRVKRLDLKSCRIESERLQRLGPGLHKCQELRLGFNNLGDSAGKVVSAALRVPGCQIQRLWLNHSGLQDPDVNHLASALRTNRSLMELDVRGNALGDSGVKLLSAVLRDPNCKLQILGLWNVGLTDSGAEDLASALRTNQSLTELDLGSNDLGDSGVKLVSAALRDPESKLQKLDLTRVELTDSGAEDLAFALSTNRSLRELDLSKNTLGDSGVKFLSEALRDPECKLQSLGSPFEFRPLLTVNPLPFQWVELSLSSGGGVRGSVTTDFIFCPALLHGFSRLICNNLTAACSEDLASVVGANPSLLELKLGINELGDEGVKLLTAALKKQDCKLQRLQLDENGLTGSCVEDLASVLGAGSSLTGLDLSYNQLGDLGVKQLSKALKSPDCKLEKLRLRAVGLTAPYVRYLASAIKANHSVVELDLGRNELRDSGVKLLSAALRKAGCRLQNQGLYAAELTDSCTDDLVTTLGVNRSITQLNLGSNSFTDLSVPALCLLVQSRENLERIKLWENQFSAEGQKQLQSLQGTRPGLRVDIQRSYDPLGTSDSNLERLQMPLNNSAGWLAQGCRSPTRYTFGPVALRERTLLGNSLTPAFETEITGSPGSSAYWEVQACKPCRTITERQLSGSPGSQRLHPQTRCAMIALRRAGFLVHRRNIISPFTQSAPRTRKTKLFAFWNKQRQLPRKSCLMFGLTENCTPTKFTCEKCQPTQHLGSNVAELEVEVADPRCCRELAEVLQMSFWQIVGATRMEAVITGDWVLWVAENPVCTDKKSRTVCRIPRAKEGDLPGRSDKLLARDGMDPVVIGNMELDMRDKKLGVAGVKRLSEALKESHCQIQRLNLWNVGLTDSGAEDLASALRTNRSVTELDLGCNDLGDSVVKLVSAALRDPESKLQKLDLTRVELTDSGAEDLAFALSTNRSLRELDLSKNTLGDSGVKFLSEALRDPECKLQSLGLICNNLTAACSEDLASVVGANPSLLELKLGINELGDEGVKLLTAALKKQDCKLQRLQLDENGLTGSCVEDLASVLGAGSSLTGLDLSYNQLGDLGVKQLSKALKSPDCKLEKLRLRAVGLTAPYVRYLASAIKANHSVVELDLGRNELRDSGVKLLSAALRTAGCRLQNQGLYAAELTDSCTDDLVTTLGVNRSITQLNLGSNSFTDLSVPALCLLVQSRENLERIKLWENQFSAEGQKQLQSLQGTRPGLRVDIQRSYDPGCRSPTRYTFGPVALRERTLLGNSLTPAFETEITGSPGAVGSGVRRGPVRQSCSPFGTSNGSFRASLWNVGLTDSGAEDLASALRTNRSVTELDLGCNDLGDSGVKLVSAALRDPESKLQKLGRQNVPVENHAIFTPHSQSDMQVPGHEVATLSLTCVELTDSGAEDLTSALSTNRSLRELDLSKNTLGDSGVNFLSGTLRDPECKLQTLRLICNDLTAACAEDIASVVGANPSLVELKLGIKELGDEGVKLLTATLKKRDCKLQRLHGDRSKDLASALRSSLTGLDLSYNQLGDLGVKQLSKALKSPDCKLEKLRLRAVGLTAPYVRYLASAVKANYSLVESDLGRNKLRDSGVKLLSAALRKAGCRLQKLGLWENQFSAEGQKQLQSLQRTRSGLRVDIQSSYDP